ncbi:hypothetical protein BCEP27_21076 [Burkholderia cepacia]
MPIRHRFPDPPNSRYCGAPGGGGRPFG